MNYRHSILVFAEGQAMRKITMHMQDWIKKLDGFLKLNDSQLLQLLVGSDKSGYWKIDE